MWSHRRTTGMLATALCAAFILALPSAASAATISNGGFEAGAFTDWTKSTQGSGDWFVYSGTTTPNGQTVAAPPQGTKAAVTEQSGPGSHVLYQDVALDASASHTLTFKLYYRSSASLLSPNTLDHAGSPNQQYRVDVMGPAAPVRSVAAADVLATVFKTQPGDPTTLAPTTISFDLTPFAGQTVRLRFAEVDNRGTFYASFDDVAIDTVAQQYQPAQAVSITSAVPQREVSRAACTASALPAGAGTPTASAPDQRHTFGRSQRQVETVHTCPVNPRPVSPLGAATSSSQIRASSVSASPPSSAASLRPVVRL